MPQKFCFLSRQKTRRVAPGTLAGGAQMEVWREIVARDGDAAEAAQPANGGQGLAALPSMAGLGGGFANEEKVKVRGEGEERKDKIRSSTSTSHFNSSAVLAAFAKDTGPAAEAVAGLLKEPSKERAEALMAKLPDLLPADPALAAVIAEEMARAFGGEMGERGE